MRPSFFMEGVRNDREPLDKHMIAPVSRWGFLILLAAALSLIACAYWPGLAGPFQFDDFVNLDAIGAYGPVDDWKTLVYYLTSGKADPTGRPVALLSFLFDAQNWPADPRPFKRTNLILHLLNTSLLVWVVMRLQSALERRQLHLKFSNWTPLVAALFWGAHPFLVSTTLYVVQREAMLPMTFSMLALLAWDQAVVQFSRDRRMSGWLWSTVGVGCCTLLAGLSKANGFLAPLLAGLAYWCCLRQPRGIKTRGSADLAAAVCLGLPSLLLLAFLAREGWSQWSLPQLPGRDWTLPQRVMSEPRALWDYVGRLILPRAGGGGLFVEGFSASRTLWDPTTTLPAIMALFASAGAALAVRRRFPIASFAWLFFLAAHLMESSVIPLELYFEHRNYLPAAFLGWPLAHMLLRPGLYPRYRAVFAALLLVVLLLLTYQRASIWGDAKLLTALSAAHQQDSVRSQISNAYQQIEEGNANEALGQMHSLLAEHPRSIDLAVSTLGMECSTTGALSPTTMSRATHALATAQTWNYGLYLWFQDAARARITQQCRGFGLAGLRTLVAAAEANPRNTTSRSRRDFLHVRGHIALASGKPKVAFEWFNAALMLEPDISYALVQAAALGNADAQGLGLAHLDLYLQVEKQRSIRFGGMGTLHHLLLRRLGYYRNEIDQLRHKLEEDAHTKLLKDKDHRDLIESPQVP